VKDGLYRVEVGGVCGGFEIQNDVITRCAPILRRKFSFWVKHAVLVPQQPERTSVNRADKTTMETTTTELVDQIPLAPESEIIDLGFDVTEADVARPVIKGGKYNATISYVRQEPSRKANLPQLLVGFRLSEPTKSIDGKDVGEGFTITQRILMQPTGGLTQQMINDRLKRIHFAAAGPGRVTTAGWVGKPVQVRVSLREPHKDKETGEEYDASNDIAGVYPPTKSAEAAA